MKVQSWQLRGYFLLNVSLLALVPGRRHVHPFIVFLRSHLHQFPGSQVQIAIELVEELLHLHLLEFLGEVLKNAFQVEV